jgi:hypothetical protein
MKFIDIIRNKNKNLVFIVIVLIIAGMSVWYALAEAMTNIKSESGFAWNENGGWLNFGSEDGGVMVYDDYLSGYAWSENLGWISLNCVNTDSCDVSDYKISNDKEGNLSGYAWGENVGWINFTPQDGGVKINSTGEFSGYAWGENIGWIVFNCQDLDVCQDADFKVATTWLPLSVRQANEKANESDSQEDEESPEGLEISDVNFSTTDTKIVVNWETNNNADGHIRWGINRNLENEDDQDEKEKKHRMVIKDLNPDTRYFFRIKSTDKNEQTDSSRIWEVSTKKSSAIFSSREWKASEDETIKTEDEKYEKVEIEISDKDEKDETHLLDETDPVEEIAQEQVSQGEGENLKEKGPSFIARGFLSIKNGVNGIFLGVRNGLLSGQKKIAKLFETTGEKISSISNSFKSKFTKEKIAKKIDNNLFTTLVFKQDERKFLAEVKFRIIDKYDNPIPNLKTTLFSDPQETTTNDDGIAAFKNVPIGEHTLAFNHGGEELKKKVEIADTLTDEGKVLAEIVQVKAQKERLAVWMWVIIISLFVVTGIAIYFGINYYKLKKLRE